MKHRLSASRLGLARRCQWWARPDAEWPERAPSREAALGTAFHKVAEVSIMSDAPATPEYEAIDDDQIDTIDRLVKSWWTWWEPARGTLQWEAERAVAWDVRTGSARWLPRTTHRDYGALGDYEIPGTIDAMAEEDGIVHIHDLKTGRQTVEAPTSNPQLGHNGGAAVAALGAEAARVTYVKVSEDNVYVAEPAELDALSFDATRDELAATIDAVAASEPQPGPWCAWCPAKGTCPETKAAVEQVVDATAIVRRTPISLSIRDNEHAAGMLTAVDAIETFISELKARLRAYADANGGIVMPDGTVYGRSEVTSERPDLTVSGALHAIESMGLEKALEHKITWAAIKKVGGPSAEKEARKVLRDLGAIKSSTSPRYEARPVKKGRAA